MLSQQIPMNEGLKHLLIEQDKRNGLTPERLFLDMLVGLTPKTNNQYPDSIFYWKNGHIWFRQDNKNGRLWCSYSYVWSVFETKYGDNYNNETQSFIKGMLEQIDNWEELTPWRTPTLSSSRFEQIGNWKELTPKMTSVFPMLELEQIDNWKSLTSKQN